MAFIGTNMDVCSVSPSFENLLIINIMQIEKIESFICRYTIVHFFTIHHIDIRKLYRFGSDGAENMRGVNNGVSVL